MTTRLSRRSKRGGAQPLAVAGAVFIRGTPMWKQAWGFAFDASARVCQNLPFLSGKTAHCLGSRWRFLRVALGIKLIGSFCQSKKVLDRLD